MSYNILQFLKDYKIEHTTDHHHCTDGRVVVHCPFCRHKYGRDNFHLGLFLDSGDGNCWRCGYHKLWDYLQLVLHSYAPSEVYKAYREYKTDAVSRILKRRESFQSSATSISLPQGTLPLPSPHQKYLIERNFNPQKLVQTYDLQGTANLGNYKFRIIAPIYFNNKLVSFQGRDITNKSALRYKNCEREKELIHHKHILYNIDNCLERKCVVVEGITDVWRMGAGFVATFGITWTAEQKLLLAERFDEIVIMYDSEINAQIQGEKLGNELALLGKQVALYNIEKDKDPAKLTDEEAEEIRKEIFK